MRTQNRITPYFETSRCLLKFNNQRNPLERLKNSPPTSLVKNRKRTAPRAIIPPAHTHIVHTHLYSHARLHVRLQQFFRLSKREYHIFDFHPRRAADKFSLAHDTLMPHLQAQQQHRERAGPDAKRASRPYCISLNHRHASAF